MTLYSLPIYTYFTKVSVNMGYYKKYRWALLLLLVILQVGAALAAAPVALLNELIWNMVKAPMFNGHHGIDINAIFGNTDDATIARTSPRHMFTLCTSDHDAIFPAVQWIHQYLHGIVIASLNTVVTDCS